MVADEHLEKIAGPQFSTSGETTEFFVIVQFVMVGEEQLQ
jgi:hypothetical protein